MWIFPRNPDTPHSSLSTCAPGVEQSTLPSAARAQNAGQLAGSGIWHSRALYGVLLRVFRAQGLEFWALVFRIA